MNISKLQKRKGKWTDEETIYAIRLIRDFRAGISPLSKGKLLREHLAEELNCETMRITKKFSGGRGIANLGKITFQSASLEIFSLEQRLIALHEIEQLRIRFLLREYYNDRRDINYVFRLIGTNADYLQHTYNPVNPILVQGNRLFPQKSKIDTDIIEGARIFYTFITKLYQDT